ncbi:MAG: hypothetical protein ACTSU5_11980 [Promethearchaeota archaeon]
MAFSRIGIFAKREGGAYEAYHLVHSSPDEYYRRKLHKNLETLFSNLNAFFPREFLTKIRIERTDRDYDMVVFYQNIFNDENKWLFTTIFIGSIDKGLPVLVNGCEEDMLTDLTDYVIRERLVSRDEFDTGPIDQFVKTTAFPTINTTKKREVFIPVSKNVAAAEWFLTICSEEGYPILYRSYVNGVPTDLVPNIPQNLTPEQKREFYVMFISGLTSSFLQFYEYGYFIRDFVLADRTIFLDRIKIDTRVEEITKVVDGKPIVVEKEVDVYFPVCLEFRNVNSDGFHTGLLGNERLVLREIVSGAGEILKSINHEEIFNQNLRREEVVPLVKKVDEIVDSYFERL